MAGSVSQNWVCRRTPPGALKQQESLTAVELWQLRGMLEGQLWREARAAPAMVVRLKKCIILPYLGWTLRVTGVSGIGGQESLYTYAK